MNSSWKGIGSYSTVGLDFALSILVGMFGGRWLDRRFGTHYIFTIVGFGFGLAAAIRTLLRALERANRDAEEQERKDRAARQHFHDHEDDR